MRLKELEIQGFKSFPDRTKITIGNGITGVVGPNGSGKSNISDAIRWVMGETSSKQLRGTGKMEDVIFGGTQTRGAMGFASVLLTVDNSDHGLDMDADEVTIGRRYYRSGESEYSINGQNVRLKDVYELLLDTGLGRDGYSIIGQGRIAEIVGAKSNERREIFEEASGISRYRYRRNEAERRLDAAEQNLERLRDILGELEGRVGPLERESKKAQQFLELSDRRKGLEVTLWVDAIHRAKDAVREQQRRYEAAEADYNRMSVQLEAFDAKTEQLRRDMQELSSSVEEENAQIRTVTEQQAGAESEIAVLKNDILHARQLIGEAKAELERSGAGRESIEKERTDHAASIAAIRQAMEALDAGVAALRGQIEELERQALAGGERRSVLEAEVARLTDGATTAKVRAASAQSAADAAREQMENARARQTESAGSAEKLEHDCADAERRVQETGEAVTRLDNIKSGLKLKLESRRKLLEQAAAALSAAEREQSAAEQRIRILEDLERSMDGYQQSVKAVMKASGVRRLRGIIGPVAGILTVKKGYETAIETALGFALQNIVVENEAAARGAIAFLKETHGGRATFLPLDTVQPSHFSGRLSGTAILASQLVQADVRYADIVSSLLGRIVVVNDLAEASATAKSLGYHNRIVTLDGQVINAGGSFTGGSTARSVGVFSRRQELDELHEKQQALAQSYAEAQKTAEAKKAEVDTLTAQLAGTESEGMTAAAEKLRAGLTLDRLRDAVRDAGQAAQKLDAEIASLGAALTQSTAEAQTAGQEAAEAETEIGEKTAALEKLGVTNDEFTARRRSLSDELSAKQLQHLADEKDIRLHEAALETLASRSGEAAARAETLRANMAAGEATIREHEQHIAAIERTKGDADAKITALEQSIHAAGTARMEKEAEQTRLSQQNRTLTDEREKMSGEMARLQERRTAADTELNDTSAKLWEEYQLTEQEAAGICIPFENITELRRLVSEVRGKIRSLGNVNVGAIDEYKEVKERYDFLKAQVGDVEKSRAELHRMIAELSDRMRELFSASFRSINEHFGHIFRELFGGGSARLYLSDETDVLESGIEIEVAPPGKVIKNLAALSGGEQALVAISIYFSILAVNPAPFCILDEIEAALDDVNVVRYAQYLRRMTDNTQFIVITHRRGTMEAADVLYGVTMQEDGVSKILKLDLEHVSAELVS
jgi:chromosome segregation protein